MVLGTEVPGEVLAGVISFLVLIVVGVTSWALVLLVRLGQVVARLEESTANLERRVSRLEDGRTARHRRVHR